jgi:alpha-D-ribose 1-methylphosphonate 5-triphosphate synthase subunit PhnI
LRATTGAALHWGEGTCTSHPTTASLGKGNVRAGPVRVRVRVPEGGFHLCFCHLCMRLCDLINYGQNKCGYPLSKGTLHL